jgi:uncharacterized protein (DUF2336 family)
MTNLSAFFNEFQNAITQGSADRRNKILRRVTDLFIVGADQYSNEEIALFDDVITSLATEIEVSARALLAVRLAPLQNAPPNIIRILAFDDEIDVACPILIQSERLDDSALVEVARKNSQAHMLAISRRHSLSEMITDVLVERGDQQVVLSTVKNQGSQFSKKGFTILIQRSDGDDELAASVGSRPEIPPQLFLNLLAVASESVRQKLEAAHPHAKREVYQVIAEIADRIQSEALAGLLDDVKIQESAEMLRRSGQLDNRKLEAFAHHGQLEETTAALALMCKLPVQFVKRAMLETRPETILILAAAIGLPWPIVKTILLARAKMRFISENEITQCLAHFERIKPATAQEIVWFYRRREQAGTNYTNGTNV